MKNNTVSFWVIVLVIGFIAWNFLSEPNKSLQDSKEVKQQKPADIQSLKVNNPWPYLSEDNSDQAISDNLLATNIYIVFDGSGSMQANACSGDKNKIDAAKQALQEFSKSIPADANVGMVTFDASGTKERVSLNKVNYAQMQQKINAISTGGGTPLSSAIDLAYIALTKQARKQLAYGEYHLLVVTDGQASDGYDPTDKLNLILSESPIVVHTIGFCIDTDHSLNQPGRTIYNTAQDYESLRKGLQSVLAEAPEFTVSDFH